VHQRDRARVRAPPTAASQRDRVIAAMAMTFLSPCSRSEAAPAICSMASSIENGVTGTSPASTTWMRANGLQSSST